MNSHGGKAPELSIIIPTQHRRESLLETLRALDPATMPPHTEVVVVDNAPHPELDPDETARAGAGRLRLLHEPRPGKWRCLNKAIATGLGQIIAVLDDDMTPMPGWAQRVIESVRTRPGFDLFAGKSHVVWPAGASVPDWAHHYLAQGVCFSVLTWDGDREREMGGALAHPSGNHFWFRRSILQSVPIFPPGWTSEAEWCMEARARGHRGVFVPGIDCGHRVQPGLIDAGVFLDRSLRFGQTTGRFTLTQDKVQGIDPARLLARKCKSVAALALWTLRERRARRQPEGVGVPTRARALLRIGRHRQLLAGPRPAHQEPPGAAS